jgi:hypothetical protein
MFLFLPISLLETVILQRMAQMQGMMIHIDGSMTPTQPQVQQMLEQMMQMMTQEFLLYAVAMFLQPVGNIAIAKMVKQYLDGEK